MARSPAAANGGWPPGPRHPAEPDPRFARGAPQGQRPAQPGGYPQQGGYPEQQPAAPGYDPQAAYHYPQGGQAAPGQQHVQQPNPRQGLSSLDTNGRGASEYAPFPAAPSPFGQQQQPAYGQPQQPAYGHPQQQQPGHGNGYRPAPPPFGAPTRQAEPAPDPRAAQPAFEQWPGAAQEPDPRAGYDLGNFLQQNTPHQHQGGMPLQADPAGHIEPHLPEWDAGAQMGYGEAAMRDPYAGGQMGYEPTHGGALEQAYQEEPMDYDVEEPRRGSWAMRIAGAVVVAVGLGYGLAQGYKLVAGDSPDGIPPVVRGDAAPSKTLPAEPGGKQFDHRDAKIMGRLGEGSPGATASVDTETDANGSRKVQTLVVGRDGSIGSPSPTSGGQVTTGAVSVPGLTVIDSFDSGYPPSAQPAAAAAQAPSRPEPTVAQTSPVVIKPPPADEPKPVKIANVTPTRKAAPSTPPKAPSAPAASAPKKTAAVSPPPSTSSGANGYVVVLASVPASGDSRLSALRKFADMQQQYGSVLQNKTPDVQEANLGSKGIYHRLLVGPPGSRSQANTLCSDLKTAGYKDCWVMAY